MHLRMLMSSCLLAFTVAGCTQTQNTADTLVTGSSPPSTVSAYQVRERYTFSSVQDMVTRADVIVVATVLTVAPGRSVGDPGGTVDFVNVELSADRIIKGTNSSPMVIEFEPMPPVGEAAGYPPFEPGSPWWLPGSTSLFFLRTTSSEGLQVINSQGLYYLPEGPDGELQATVPDDQVGTSISGRTVSELFESVGWGSP